MDSREDPISALESVFWKEVVAFLSQRMAHHLQHSGSFGGSLGTFPDRETGLSALPYLRGAA